ncbi:MAG: helix-turn-helix domain-containing protein [Rhodobacter sp.]|jgi:ArsR family transcriptional regulator|nr:helix-turn-helix transcriptional regulator [Rhodobacter sp.]MCE2748482.1 helix-turn-helix domain-containing protein [Rhodobacter sp.]
MERSKVPAALAALANDRRRVPCLPADALGETGLSAGEIGRQLGMTPLRLSFHLAALGRAGLIRSRRASRTVFCTADLRGPGQTTGCLLRDRSLDHPGVRACRRSHA